jgi:hypothetical protein
LDASERSNLNTGLRLALSKGPNRVGVSLFSPEDGEKDPFSKMLCFTVISNLGRWTKTVKKLKPPSNRPWGPVGFRDVEDLTSSR